MYTYVDTRGFFHREARGTIVFWFLLQNLPFDVSTKQTFLTTHSIVCGQIILYRNIHQIRPVHEMGENQLLSIFIGSKIMFRVIFHFQFL